MAALMAVTAVALPLPKGRAGRVRCRVRAQPQLPRLIAAAPCEGWARPRYLQQSRRKMPSSAPRARYDDYDDDEDEDGFDAVDDDDEDGDFYDDGEDDDEDEEELEAWERAAAAEEVVYDEEELEELKAAEAEREADALFDYETREAGGEDELRFASEEDRELAENRRRLAKRGIRVMGYDRDPRMRIMTETGERWDSDGTDRLKFAWEKVNYEVPEVHDTPEMKAATEAAQLEMRARNGDPDALPPMDPELKEMWKDLVEGDKMGHVYGDTGESWAALEKYYYGKARDRVARMEAHVARSIELGLVLDRKKRLTMTDEEVKEFEDGIEGRLEEHKEEVAKLQEEFDVLLEEFEEWEDDEDEDEWDLEPQDEDDLSPPKLTIHSTITRWNKLEPYVRAAFPDEPQASWNVMTDTYHNAEERLRWVDPPVAEPIPEFEEVKLDTWEMRCRYEHLKAKALRREAYWKDFEERVGKQARLELDCTHHNDTRLRPKDHEPRRWTHEEIMAVITENGMNADPEQAMRDSMTIIDPLEPLDHVFDMGVQYVPSMEESIAELGLMVPDFAERNYNFGMEEQDVDDVWGMDEDEVGEWLDEDGEKEEEEEEEELDMEIDMYEEVEDQLGGSSGSKGTKKTGRKRR
mmetsp:Transcript_18817/g.48307  ORF Transcript_18817/g.48307 Transcript_18817/m.48307 type:complete len:637 (-) Transcript_18817:1253-3163(-)